LSKAVPETTPNCPALETARASFQLETATPMPPWIIIGSVIPSPLGFKKGIIQTDTDGA
jgi:hypothetical protein